MHSYAYCPVAISCHIELSKNEYDWNDSLQIACSLLGSTTDSQCVSEMLEVYHQALAVNIKQGTVTGQLVKLNYYKVCTDSAHDTILPSNVQGRVV